MCGSEKPRSTATSAAYAHAATAEARARADGDGASAAAATAPSLLSAFCWEDLDYEDEDEDEEAGGVLTDELCGNGARASVASPSGDALSAHEATLAMPMAPLTGEMDLFEE